MADGTGGWRFFSGSGGSYTSPAGDNGTLSGTYTQRGSRNQRRDLQTASSRWIMEFAEAP